MLRYSLGTELIITVHPAITRSLRDCVIFVSAIFPHRCSLRFVIIETIILFCDKRGRGNRLFCACSVNCCSRYRRAIATRVSLHHRHVLCVLCSMVQLSLQLQKFSWSRYTVWSDHNLDLNGLNSKWKWLLSKQLHWTQCCIMQLLSVKLVT